MTENEATGTSVWAIGLDAWIIQDGNYPNLQRGQKVEFALQFWLEKPEFVEPTTASAVLVRDCEYQIAGRVAFASEAAWVVDWGLLSYCGGAPPKGLEGGDWIGGAIFVTVDPFDYFESLYRVPDMPALIYSWEIERIRRQNCPLRGGCARSPRTRCVQVGLHRCRAH